MKLYRAGLYWWLGYTDGYGKVWLVTRVGRVGDCIRP